MSRRQVARSRRQSARDRQQAEQVRRRQQDGGYWTTFVTDLQVTR